MSSRKTASREPDALDLLIADHKKVLKLFDDFEKLVSSDEEDDAGRQSLVEKTCNELTIHSQLEEEIFYPALRDALDDVSLLDEAEVEHDMANRLIAELEAMDPGDDLYNARFKVLGEYVRHHIEEEQEKLFPKAKKAKLALIEMGRELSERKEALMLDFGMPEDGSVEEDGHGQVRPRGSARRSLGNGLS